MKRLTVAITVLFLVVISTTLITSKKVSKEVLFEEVSVVETSGAVFTDTPSENLELAIAPVVEDPKKTAITVFEQRTKQLNDFGASIKYPNIRGQDRILVAKSGDPKAFDEESARFLAKSSKSHNEAASRAIAQEAAFKKLEEDLGPEGFKDYLKKRPQPKPAGHWPQLPRPYVPRSLSQ